MRLLSIQNFLREHRIDFTYNEENDAGSIDFMYRGIAYHIWEYPAPERGAAANIRNIGRQNDYEDNYEDQLLEDLKHWELP